MTNQYLAKFASKVLTAFPDVIQGLSALVTQFEIDSVGRQRIAEERQPGEPIRVLVTSVDHRRQSP